MINIIKSLLLGILVFFAFFFVLANIFNGSSAEMAILGISIISTIIFCTYTIMDTIKKYCGK